jgi:hypothetical protein
MPALSIRERANFPIAVDGLTRAPLSHRPHPAFARAWFLGFWRDLPRAFLQRILQVDRDAVFLEQIGKCFIDQFLEGCHPAAAEISQLDERILVYLYPSARHRYAVLRLRLATGLADVLAGLPAIGRSISFWPDAVFATGLRLCLGSLRRLGTIARNAAFQRIHEMDDVVAARSGFRPNGLAGALCVDQVVEGGLIAALELLGIELAGFPS